MWLGVGIVAMMVIIYFGYDLYGHYANTFYVLNIVLLVVVLGMEAGRGGMTAFFTWGSGSERTFQPSEVGKIAMIIAFAKAFCRARQARDDRARPSAPRSSTWAYRFC